MMAVRAGQGGLAALASVSLALGCSVSEDTCVEDVSASSAADASAGEGGEPPMFCQPMCSEPADCCPPPEDLPPGISCPAEYPFNFVCPDGVCRPGGCSCDDDCHRGGPTDNDVCMPVAGGVNLCRSPCTADDDCAQESPLSDMCSGVAADGRRYCEGLSFGSCEPGDPCNGWGVCIDGRCGCTSNADCMDSWGCTPDWG